MINATLTSAYKDMIMISKIISLLIFLLITGGASQIRFSGLTPPQEHVKDPVTISISKQLSAKADSLTVVLTLNMDKHIHIYASESLFFRISFSKTEGLGGGAIELPEAHIFQNADKTKAFVFVNGQKIVLRYPIISGNWLLKGNIRYQACDTAMCFTPRVINFTAASDGALFTSPDTSERVGGIGPVGMTDSPDLMKMLDRFEIVGTTGGFLNVKKFSKFLAEPSTAKKTENQDLEGKGLFVIIFLVLLGGITLNLTPCVLPMIPITLAVIGAGTQARSSMYGMVVGGIYGIAMAITYGVLGLIVILSGSQFGIINSSPLFNIVIAVIFIIMALAMFDVISVDFTRFRKGTASFDRGNLPTVFVMGVVASVLAGACVAPVVISVILYAGKLFAEGRPEGLALPFILGLGMALPWPFAGAGLSFLPKPGKWMVWVKYTFGVFILATAIYYGYTGISLYVNTYKSDKTEIKSSGSSPGWVYSIEEGLQRAETEKKPLFIDFSASWCKNCKAMEATTFRDRRIEELFRKYILVKYAAERPEEPSTKKVLERFGVVGLPTYVILKLKED